MSAASDRLWSIDASRGLSVIIMIILHLGLVISLSQSAINAIGLFQPEPFFIMVAGLSSPILLSKKYVADDRRVLLVRGLLLVALDLAMIFTASRIWPSVYTFRLYWGVFPIIGLSYLILFFVDMNLRRALPLFIGLVAATPVLSFLAVDLFGNMFYNLAYFFAGVCTYYFVFQNKIKLIWPIMAAALAYIACAVMAIDPLSWSYWGYQLSPVMSVIVVSLNIALLVKVLSMFDAKEIVTRSFSWTASLGRISFSIFALHMVIIYLIMKMMLIVNPGTIVPIHNFELYVVVLVAIIALLVALEKIWRKYDYLLGLEWFFRKGVAQVLLLVDRITGQRQRS